MINRNTEATNILSNILPYLIRISSPQPPWYVAPDAKNNGHFDAKNFPRNFRAPQQLQKIRGAGTQFTTSLERLCTRSQPSRRCTGRFPHPAVHRDDTGTPRLDPRSLSVPRHHLRRRTDLRG